MVTDHLLPWASRGQPEQLKGGRAYRTLSSRCAMAKVRGGKDSKCGKSCYGASEHRRSARWEYERIIDENAVFKTLFFFHPEAQDTEKWKVLETMVISALQRGGIVPPEFTFSFSADRIFFPKWRFGRNRKRQLDHYILSNSILAFSRRTPHVRATALSVDADYEVHASLITK